MLFQVGSRTSLGPGPAGSKATLLAAMLYYPWGDKDAKTEWEGPRGTNVLWEILKPSPFVAPGLNTLSHSLLHFHEEIVIRCHGLNVCVPAKLIYWNSDAQHYDIRRWAFGRYRGREGGAHRMGLLPFSDPRELSSHFYHERTWWESTGYETGNGCLPEHNQSGTLVLDFQPPETVKNKYVPCIRQLVINFVTGFQIDKKTKEVEEGGKGIIVLCWARKRASLLSSFHYLSTLWTSMYQLICVPVSVSERWK